MSTPLNRVETLLQNSDKALYIHQIVALADVGEKEAKTSIKTLHDMGQIETIQTPGRWGNRYAWLAAKPVISEPVVIAEADQVDKVADRQESLVDKTPNLQCPTEITGDGSGEALPEIPILDGSPAEAIASAMKKSLSNLPEAFSSLLGQQSIAQHQASARYVVAVPKRPLRIVKSLARAEALALSAVRRGAKGAEVFALMPVGHAKQEAVFQEAIA
ncbi:hypothetical protein [Neopusillimonas aromaticivorans]|uniref:hypothetical protein n=1 Tax=Neopusillimonas aromaticivorans TaxID=2979868 RepID=UPI002596D35E|nr:hypothetical protein [Neopusillimonas aromaticivorans]WJJ93405.1 hypothetical protein N7E01_15800 [Neopusillimonas aromaticivorans]